MKSETIFVQYSHPELEDNIDDQSQVVHTVDARDQSSEWDEVGCIAQAWIGFSPLASFFAQQLGVLQESVVSFVYPSWFQGEDAVAQTRQAWEREAAHADKVIALCELRIKAVLLAFDLFNVHLESSPERHRILADLPTLMKTELEVAGLQWDPAGTLKGWVKLLDKALRHWQEQRSWAQTEKLRRVSRLEQLDLQARTQRLLVQGIAFLGKDIEQQRALAVVPGQVSLAEGHLRAQQHLAVHALHPYAKGWQWLLDASGEWDEEEWCRIGDLDGRSSNGSYGAPITEADEDTQRIWADYVRRMRTRVPRRVQTNAEGQPNPQDKSNQTGKVSPSGDLGGLGVSGVSDK